MTGHTKERCSMGVGCDEFNVCYAASHKQPWRCPHTTDREAKGWLWLDEMVGRICHEHAADITYSADQMVDAFMAGMDNAPTLATIPDPLAFVQASRVLHRALEGVIDATASYLPPDGISKDDCINRVLAASDNADVVHALRAFRAATGEA